MAIYLSRLAKYAFYFLFDKTTAAFQGTSSSTCPGKSLLPEPESGFINHDQRYLVLKSCVWRFCHILPGVAREGTQFYAMVRV